MCYSLCFLLNLASNSRKQNWKSPRVFVCKQWKGLQAHDFGLFIAVLGRSHLWPCTGLYRFKCAYCFSSLLLTPLHYTEVVVASLWLSVGLLPFTLLIRLVCGTLMALLGINAQWQWCKVWENALFIDADGVWKQIWTVICGRCQNFQA